MTNWIEFDRLLAAKHVNRPQNAARARNALAAIHGGIGELETLGHRFDLVLDAPHEAKSWPRMFYHRQFAPGGQVFDTEKDRPLASEGWSEKPDFAVAAKAPPSIGAATAAVQTKGDSDHAGARFVAPQVPIAPAATKTVVQAPPKPPVVTKESAELGDG